MIKFTVVTCTYNAEKELQRTLDSVQRQTYCNIEHIIMDGGSRDRTLQLVKAYQHRNAVGESSHCFINRDGKVISLKREAPELFEMLRSNVQSNNE